MATRRATTLSTMTKAEIITNLRELGEEPPRHWTKVELKSRLMELETELGIKRGPRREPTSLQAWVTKLNTVNKKRGTLRTFLTEELGGYAADSCTKDQLNKIAMDHIYERAEMCGSDPVGFGQHAAKTYQEVKTMDPDYCRWVKATAPESGSVRLIRLAKWLESPETTHETESLGGQRTTPLPKAKAPPPTLREAESASSSTPSRAQVAETQAVMRQLVKAVQELQSEVDTLKEERPRKKAADGVESSGSYSQVTSIVVEDDEGL